MELREAGFTLVEIIASLVLVGFLTVFAGIGLTTFMRGYLFATENSHMSQKSQIAMTRMTRELLELTDITSASASAVTLANIYGTRTIGLDNGKIKIDESGTALSTGDTLIDNVGGFTLSYYSGSQSWSDDMDIRLLSAIQIQLTVNRSDSGIGSVTFTTTVHPRNTNNLGGAPPATTPSNQTDYCFIGAAGQWPPPDVRHLPAVLLLVLAAPFCGLIFRRRKNRQPQASGSQQGSIVVALIIGIVVISALGAAMLPLTGTSIFQQLWTLNNSRSYFLAESGLRYAASQYLNAGDEDARTLMLDGLNDTEYALSDNAGKFDLQIYSYFFKTPAGTDQSNTSSLETWVPGSFPPDLTLSFGRLKIGNNIYDYDSADRDGQNVTFQMSAPVPFVEGGTDVLSVAESSNVSQTVVQGGNIALKVGTGSAFPQRNGTFSVNGNVYSYLENDLTNNRLEGIQDPNEETMAAFQVSASTDIVLQKFVKVHANGTYGQGPVATQRELVYHLPLPFSAEERVVFQDTFEDLSQWQAPTYGSFAVQTIGGDKAVKVTGYSSISGVPKASLMAWDWSASGVDLAASHRLGANFMLSYDAQVKVGFVNTPTPTQGFDPEPIPKYFTAGLSFRLDNSQNSYGLSFLRGANGIPSPYDNLDDHTVPLNNTPLIVLWQAINNGATRRWIAYKDLSEQTFMGDDVESGTNGWTSQGLWHISQHRSASTSHAWYFGQEVQRTYDIGTAQGGLISPAIYLTPGYCYTLSYWSWHSTETQDPDTYDLKEVYISTNGGTSWTRLEQLRGSYSDWHERQIDLSNYSGSNIKIRFYFNSRDGLYNNYEGWYVDDIKLLIQFPLEESTLAVRVKEAAGVGFTNGGTVAIKDGEKIQGVSSGATAAVDGDPILASGSWSGGNAAGTLTLRNVSGTFQVGETVQLTGSAAQATVQSFRTRDNYIRAYYGTTSDCGSANGDPTDFEKSPNARGSANWPPDEVADWTAENDYFYLVQWDAVNSAVSTASLVASADETGGIIRSSQSALLTPASGTFNQPELGLHSLGHGVLNAYFDDFAVQTDIASISRAAPLQE